MSLAGRYHSKNNSMRKSIAAMKTPNSPAHGPKLPTLLNLSTNENPVSYKSL